MLDLREIDVAVSSDSGKTHTLTATCSLDYTYPLDPRLRPYNRIEITSLRIGSREVPAKIFDHYHDEIHEVAKLCFEYE